ncbi:LysR family transcriptional regulator [Achromobacter aloeverae]|uniref:LysR family transcriptional regulator n=1 Tax=Achromobacter aloeverae TaxID=1750518 RepID=A0A4Q1HQ74_9BURK|nr:LysR family transcriptional regulator [Achromobacter aloeverae]RXN91724.1 LysR family transcriptional regulator [Achromobacter aloeverae]
MAVLDVESVSAFVLVADLGSFTKAAHALGTSQAAVSVKLKRLEDRLGYRLLERTPRKVRLSARGAGFLKPARHFIAAHEQALSGLERGPRRLAIGFSDQVAGPGLPGLLANLRAHDPALLMEVRIEGSAKLLEAYDRGLLDAVIARNSDGYREGALLLRERLGWFAAPTWDREEGLPLPLASLTVDCGIRGLATAALDAAGIAWTEVFIGGGTAAVGAAVSAGLGIAPIPYSMAPADTVEIGQAHGLPPLPDSDIILISAVGDPATRAALRTVAASFRGGEASRRGQG